MVGGGLLCLPRFFKYSAVLLLVVCKHDVEASCGNVVHKNVGDTVELPSCLPNEGVIIATWKYKGKKIIEWDLHGVTTFEDRADINPTNFSLTLKTVTLEDSGVYYFLSATNVTQRNTIQITLQVHEAITQEPGLVVVNSTWHAVNSSCTVLLECHAAHATGVSYRWTVRDGSYWGSRVNVPLKPQDGDTTVTCTVSNSISEKSKSVAVKCNNDTTSVLAVAEPRRSTIYMAVAAGIGCLVLVTLSVAVCYCKQRQAGTDFPDNTIYADISNNPTVKDERSNNLMNPPSIYETIDDRVDSVTLGPQTVYDKIHLNRLTEASTSP